MWSSGGNLVTLHVAKLCTIGGTLTQHCVLSIIVTEGHKSIFEVD